MDSIIQAFAAGSSWPWLVLGVALVTLEIATPTTYLLWPGLAALALGLVTAVTGPFDWRLQGVIFAVFSIASTFAWRAYLTRRGTPPTDAPLLNQRAQQYLGRRAVVTEAFANGRGKIKLDDSLWSAEAVDGGNPASGEAVVVVGAAGPVLHVRSAEETKPL